MMIKKIFLIFLIFFLAFSFSGSIPDGEPCANNQDCQSGSCIEVPNPDNGWINEKICAPSSSSPSTSCKSYDQACSSANDCCTGLVCKQFGSISKCTQPDNICSNMPISWNPSMISSSGTLGGNAGSPSNKTQELVEGRGLIKSTSSIYSVGWFSDWKASSLIAVLISVFIISLAAIFGHAFNLPELKAFVDREFMQTILSVLIIVGLFGIISFLHEVTSQVVDATGLPVSCNPDEPCYLSAGKQYLDNIYSVAKENAYTALKESFNNQKVASIAPNIQASVWYLLFAGISIRPNAGASIAAERAGIIFEESTKILSSIYAQRYFLDVISFGIAPIFLLLGTILRTFSFTRKLGGLLLAIAIALFIVYPLTYVLAWYTLNINVYGERAIAAPPSSCPSECTASPPVAFYVNKSGAIIQFDTVQDILRAGLNRTNWNTGLVKDKNGNIIANYSGLVACVDLSSIGITAPSGCSKDCPLECRTVPFPDSNPSCSISKCAACNAGCKIVRQRTDCNKPEVCPSTSCPSECKLRPPFENKCFLSNDITPADLSVSCAGCDGCPAWCRVLYNDSNGNLQLLYKDNPACNIAACKPPSLGGSCPENCAYISTLPSSSTDCDSLCTGCPSYCRIQELEAQATTYDITNVLQDCLTPATKNACNKCPSGCKISLPSSTNDYFQNCSSFPIKTFSDCIGCPLFCRFNEFKNYLSEGSASDLITVNSNGEQKLIPTVCLENIYYGINCAESACGSACKNTNYPPLCLEYSATSPNPAYCKKCPEQLRVTLIHYSAKNDNKDYEGGPLLSNSVNCQECDSLCKKQQFEVPNELPLCEDYNPSASDSANCKKCPIGCRVKVNNNGWLDSACNSAECTNDCSDYCKVDLSSSSSAPICMPYLGNGENSIFTPIDSRSPPFNDRTKCRQCPEYCRIIVNGIIYEGDCGVIGNSVTDENGNVVYKNLFIDCSAENCPQACRVPLENPPSSSSSCKDSNIVIGKSCTGCNAFCRRSEYVGLPLACNPICRSDQYCDTSQNPPTCVDMPSSEELGELRLDGPCPSVFCGAPSTQTTGCMQSCILPDPPKSLCEGCIECPMDCLYEPAIRNDCSDVCSEEELAGPLNIGPSDFLKKMPGAAATMLDVKNIGQLMLPAVVLPLFGIVIVISFIRGLSSLLGGDIDIPGIGKII